MVARLMRQSATSGRGSGSLVPRLLAVAACAATCMSLLAFMVELRSDGPPPVWATAAHGSESGGGRRQGRGMFAGSAAAAQKGGHRRKNVRRQAAAIPAGFPGAHPRFVAAMGSDLRHAGIVNASRGGWRKGIRTLVAVEAPPPETAAERALQLEEWAIYSDNPREQIEDNPGAVRSALSPWLAHQQAFGGRFEWLLWGDDDTMWFMPALQQLVAGLDPKTPYLVSDHNWFCPPQGPYVHPAPMAPRCLPCGYNVSAEGMQPLPYEPPIGCPCTPQLLCQHDRRTDGTFTQHLRSQQAIGPNRADPPLWLFDEQCSQFSFKELPDVLMSVHGGAGAVLSIGLLNAIPLDRMERCLRTANHTSGSDALISRCLWELGVAPTDPGHSFFRRPGAFDPALELTDRVLAQLQAPECDARCQMEIDNRVTLHTRSATQPDLAAAADKLRLVNDVFYGEYLERRRAGSRAAHAAGRREVGAVSVV